MFQTPNLGLAASGGVHPNTRGVPQLRRASAQIWDQAQLRHLDCQGPAPGSRTTPSSGFVKAEVNTRLPERRASHFLDVVSNFPGSQASIFGILCTKVLDS